MFRQGTGLWQPLQLAAYKSCQLHTGHSAAVFLAAAPQATLHVFDLMTLPYSQPQVALFKRTHNSKVKVYKGSSFDLLPWFTSKNVQCDVFSVDGDHSFEGAYRRKIGLGQ
jgi:hypothetical protein